MSQRIDLTGKRFGRLTAIKPTASKRRGSYIWECQCDCGNTILADASYLGCGMIKSCGCLHRENAVKHAELAREKMKVNYVEGTNIKLLQSSPSVRNNSGVVGVMYDKHINLWRAFISFKKRRYYLGYYKEKGAAIAARKEAEQRIHGEFLEWYYSQFPERRPKDPSQPSD